MTTPATERRIRQLFALLRRANVTDRDDRLALLSAILHRPVDSTADTTDIELHAVIDVLSYWDRLTELRDRCATTIAAQRAISPHDLEDSHSECVSQTASAVLDQTFRDSHTQGAPQPPSAVPEPPLRNRHGHQLIQVEFQPGGPTFTYAWAGGTDLKVGDKVQTPPAGTWWHSKPQEDGAIATVCALGSYYAGTITVLTKKIKETS